MIIIMGRGDAARQLQFYFHFYTASVGGDATVKTRLNTYMRKLVRFGGQRIIEMLDPSQERQEGDVSKVLTSEEHATSTFIFNCIYFGTDDSDLSLINIAK